MKLKISHGETYSFEIIPKILGIKKEEKVFTFKDFGAGICCGCKDRKDLVAENLKSSCSSDNCSDKARICQTCFMNFVNDVERLCRENKIKCNANKVKWKE